jgi:glucose-6-phosphate dehydrogenase assembly protein OpcA
LGCDVTGVLYLSNVLQLVIRIITQCSNVVDRQRQSFHSSQLENICFGNADLG